MRKLMICVPFENFYILRSSNTDSELDEDSKPFLNIDENNVCLLRSG